MVYCTECGKEIRRGAKFCPQCGTPVATVRRPAKPAKVEKEPEKLPELGRQPLRLIRTARFALGGLLVVLVILAIWASTFWPLAPITFSYFLITICVLVAGWFALAFGVKKRLGELGVKAGFLQTIAMVFGRRARVKVSPLRTEARERFPRRVMPKLGRRGKIAVVGTAVAAVLAAVFFLTQGANPTMTFSELWSDYGWAENQPNFKSYNPGDVIQIRDTISGVIYNENLYVTLLTLESMRGFMGYEVAENWFYIQLEGDRRSEYHIGETVTILVHVVNYTWDNVVFESLDESPFLVPYYAGTFYGRTLKFLGWPSFLTTTPSEIKTVVTETGFYGENWWMYSYHEVEPLSNFTAKILDYSGAVIDEMSPLVTGSSSGEHITFNDANNNGLLDNNDYFTISGLETSSKHVFKTYTFMVKSSTISDDIRFTAWHDRLLSYIGFRGL